MSSQDSNRTLLDSQEKEKDDVVILEFADNNDEEEESSFEFDESPEQQQKTFKRIKKKVIAPQNKLPSQNEEAPSLPSFVSSSSSPKCSDADNLEKLYENARCEENDLYENKKCNEFILRKELTERSCLSEEDDDVKLYPSLNDEHFNIKIAEKEEFSSLRYDGEIYKDINKRATTLSQQKFGSSPHQQFVKTFFSSQTPYNSLLLYHGVGSGKTCSAIGVCEEFRDHLRDMYTKKKRILVVASRLLQAGFQKQLFDEDKLKNENGVWNLDSCVGEKLLKEINPTNFAGQDKEEISAKITALIASNYEFKAYRELYLDIKNLLAKAPNGNEEIKRKLVSKEYSGRLIVIDEVHNVTSTGTKITRRSTSKKGLVDVKIPSQEEKDHATAITWIVKYAENIKLLMLTATPMYNSYKEIRWLLNIMNKNDKRSIIGKKDIVFNTDTNELTDESKEILIRKSTGYVSVVRGENPYTFPYKILPQLFAPENSFSSNPVPSRSMSGKDIPKSFRMRGILPIYLTKFEKSCQDDTCNNCQSCIYKNIVEEMYPKIMPVGVPSIKNKDEDSKGEEDEEGEEDDKDEEAGNKEDEDDDYDEEEEDITEKINLYELRLPLSALVMTYPNENPNSSYLRYKDLTGKKGLSAHMEYNEEQNKYSYIDQGFRLFKRKNIQKYSSKIYNVIQSIQKEKDAIAEGVILIYAEHIESAIIPMALALEEMGFVNRHGNLLNAVTPSQKGIYTILQGDAKKCPPEQRSQDVSELTNPQNKDGKLIKIVIISMAGAEGIDLKFIRQVHILEPWYNMSRNEQIIGRAVRQFSHQLLPLEKRNVQIFMYGMILKDNHESADLLLYRHAERKAIQIGQVSRILKENAVDCILNHEQTEFTQRKMNIEVKQELSTGKRVIEKYRVGDIDYSSLCDYMQCEFECNENGHGDDANNFDTYNISFISINMTKIVRIIRRLMQEQFFYKREKLIQLIELDKVFPRIQIFAALSSLVDDENEFIIDKYERKGRLINIDDYYLFQPEELSNPNLSVFDRTVPIDFKRTMVPIVFGEESGQEQEQEQEDEPEREEEDDLLNIPEKEKEEFDKVFLYLAEKQIQITEEEKEKLITHHFIETLSFSEKIKLMRTSILKQGVVSEYFKERQVSNHYMLNDVFVCKFLDNTFNINEAEPPRFIEELKKIYKVSTFPFRLEKDKKKDKKKEDDMKAKRERAVVAFSPQFADYVGFMGYKKKTKGGDNEIVFKFKEHDEIFTINVLGTTCTDGSSNMERIDILNTVLRKLDERAILFSMADVNKKEGKSKKDMLSKEDLCLALELLLRLCEFRKTEQKIWFLTPELALYFDLYRG